MDIGSVLLPLWKLHLRRKLYGGCMDSSVGVVMEPSSIDKIYCYIILIIWGFKKKGKIVISE